MSIEKNTSTPVIDWNSAPEGFPIWIEDLIPFGESTSCWAKDAGNHYLGVNGSKWDKPSGIDFGVHYPTPDAILPVQYEAVHRLIDEQIQALDMTAEQVIEVRDKALAMINKPLTALGADAQAEFSAFIRESQEAMFGEDLARKMFPGAYVVKECSPVMAAALLEQLRSSMGAQNLRSVVLMKPASVEVDFHPSIRCVDPELTVASDRDVKWPSGVKWLSVGEPFQAPEIEWAEAPEGTTHCLNELGITWYRKAGDGFEFFGNHGHWKASHASIERLLDTLIARPSPREKWSLDGKDGTWDYDTLAELVIDNYGHDSCGDGHPASYRPGLYEGDTIYRATPYFDDPVRFLPEAHDVIDHMADQVSDSDASEYADHYPEVDDEARAALEVALEPLKAWARKHCQPDFFTVKDVTPYILTEEDVRAAKAQERAQ